MDYVNPYNSQIKTGKIIDSEREALKEKTIIELKLFIKRRTIHFQTITCNTINFYWVNQIAK